MAKARKVSTHAPVRARRLSISGRRNEDERFNSRAREGATSLRTWISRPMRCFNSRAREGATRASFSMGRL